MAWTKAHLSSGICPFWLPRNAPRFQRHMGCILQSWFCSRFSRWTISRSRKRALPKIAAPRNPMPIPRSHFVLRGRPSPHYREGRRPRPAEPPNTMPFRQHAGQPRRLFKNLRFMRPNQACCSGPTDQLLKNRKRHISCGADAEPGEATLEAGILIKRGALVHQWHGSIRTPCRDCHIGAFSSHSTVEPTETVEKAEKIVGRSFPRHHGLRFGLSAHELNQPTTRAVHGEDGKMVCCLPKDPPYYRAWDGQSKWRKVERAQIRSHSRHPP